MFTSPHRRFARPWRVLRGYRDTLGMKGGALDHRQKVDITKTKLPKFRGLLERVGKWIGETVIAQ